MKRRSLLKFLPVRLLVPLVPFAGVWAAASANDAAPASVLAAGGPSAQGRTK